MKTIISILFFGVVYNMIAILFCYVVLKKIVDTVEHLFVFVIRGNIFDTNGYLIATTIRKYDLIINPSLLREPKKFELRLINSDDNEEMTSMRLRAHRDELISLENELSDRLDFKSDGSLFKTPI